MKFFNLLKKKFFSHQCWVYAKETSHSFYKCGDHGVIFKQSIEYKCTKCQRKWEE